MHFTNKDIDRRNLFRVRPAFLLCCAIFLLVLILPDAIHGRKEVQRSLLVVASLALVSGWFFLWKYREPNQTWRAVIALIASLYLTVSLPIFFFEAAPMRWMGRHYLISMYAWPWAHWGYTLVFFGVAGSFLGRGRARLAFAIGATLLMVLRLSMGVWAW